jgi:putative transposase
MGCQFKLDCGILILSKHVMRKMFVLEFKVKAKTQQYQAIDDAIRTAQFIRNKCVRLWMDTKGRGKNELYKYSKELAHDFNAS